MANNFTNLGSRVLVAVVAIPLFIAVSYYGGVAFMLLVLGIGLLGLHEFFQLAKAKGANPQTVIAMIGLVCIHLSFFHEKLELFVLPFFIDKGGIALLGKLQLFLTAFFLLTVVVLVIELFRNAGSIFTNAGATLFGIVYVGVFLGALTGIRELFGNEFPIQLAMRQFPGISSLSDDLVRTSTYQWGGLTIISILASIWMCDTAAYFGGLTMGRHKLFPRVSPNKSWEGSAWGFAASIVTMVVFQKYFLIRLS
jgi:phosphatidate cytidylyltransferase